MLDLSAPCARCGCVGLHGCTGQRLTKSVPGTNPPQDEPLQKAFGPFAHDQRDGALTDPSNNLGGLR